MTEWETEHERLRDAFYATWAARNDHAESLGEWDLAHVPVFEASFIAEYQAKAAQLTAEHQAALVAYTNHILLRYA